MTKEAMNNFNAGMIMYGCDGTYIKKVATSYTTSAITMYIGMVGLDVIKVPEGVEVISKNPEMKLPDNHSLTRVLVPSSVKNIKIYAFEGFKSLEQVTGCDGVEELGYGAFLSCEKLKHIAMQSCKKIGGSCFTGCRQLETAEFPSVKDVGFKAFSLCKSLKSINGERIGLSAYNSSMVFGKW